ncbi:MAG: M1 family metallopeptidase [bacterium]|nr:M1 family metallopeptidase [bacterium]
MWRRTGLWLSLALLAAACSGTDGVDSSATPPTSAVSSTPAPVSTMASTTSEPDDGSGRGNEGFTRFAGPPESLGIGDNYFPDLGNPGYDVNHYTLDLVFEPAATRLGGVVTIEATALQALTTFNLDFTGLTIDSVAVDGSEAAFELIEEDVVISPQTPIAQDEEFTIDVEYGGQPRSTGSGAVPFGIGWTTVNGQNYVVAEPDGAHSWFPSNDHPLDKATYTFRINVPDGVTAAASGTFVEQITDVGRSIWVWEMRSPMTTYLATVVIGDFDIVEDPAASLDAGVAIRHVLPAGTTVADWPGLERQGEMIAYLAELFGPYPFETYGIAIVEGFGAALENQTLSLFDRNLAESFFFEDVLIHELAHQWFGDSVSLGQWSDIWLNEGFASYAEWLWIEREQGRATLETGIAVERDQFDEAGFNAPGVPPSFDLFNRAVYRVGAMTLHALRLTVGDDAFFDILKAYAARFANGSAVTADFVALAEEISAMELDDLFDAWLIEQPVPQFPPGE